MFTLPDLPYAVDALKPHLTAKQLELHHDKHHAAYVKNLNKLIKDTTFEQLSLEQIIDRAYGTMYNNAAQHWNHSFFWKCMTPNKTSLSDPLATVIYNKWDNYNAFKDDLVSHVTKFFGSGWVWLAYNNEIGQVQLVDTNNAGCLCPSTNLKYVPIFVIDCWEHAFYVDYPADKKAYVDAFCNILDWNFANKNFEVAKS